MKVKTSEFRKGAGKLISRYLFIKKIIFKAILIFILGFTLSGCALLGLLLRLAPLAAAVLVEYSPPVQVEEKQILCVKSQHYIERQAGQTHIVKSEYFLVMLDNKGEEVAIAPLEVGQDYFEAEKFVITKINEETFSLNLLDKKLNKDWEVEIREFSVLSCQPHQPYSTLH